MARVNELRGERGERGEPGRRLPAGQARAIVYLFLVNTVLVVAGYLLLSSAVHHEQAAQHAQAQIAERKLCTTLGRLAQLHPPAGSPRANPSRGYLQDLHSTLAQLGPDIGCR